MTYSQADWTRCDFSRLMGLSSVMADLTLSPDTLVQIPGFLAATLDLEPTAFAVVSHQRDEAAIRWFAHSTANSTAESVAQSKKRIIDIYRQTKPLAAGDAPALRESVNGSNHKVAFSQAEGELVLSRAINESHRLLLVVTCHTPDGPSAVLAETLEFVAANLAKLLANLVAWTDDPAMLGSPFDRLTEREWIVLQALRSEDGEKQLADRLELSPHTLHSHIKSIYRKLGVQGRLPVLLRLATAQRTVRMRAVATKVAVNRSSEAKHAVAVG